MEGVEWGIPVGLDVLASSYPHLKIVARTKGSGLDKRYRMYGAGRGGIDCWGAGSSVELVLLKLKVDPRPAIGWPGAGSAVSVDQRLVSRDFCRNGYRPVTLLLPMLSSLSQQLPDEERRSWLYRPKK